MSGVDWKTKLDGRCECFTGGHNKFGLSSVACLYPTTCDSNALRNLLLDTKPPTLVEFISCLLKLGIFTRKEIIFAVQDMYKNNFDAAEVAYTKTHWKLKQEGFKFIKDRNNYVKATKDVPCTQFT